MSDSPKKRGRKKQSEAERIKEMEKAALNAAILKPFLESLFDDNKEGPGGAGGAGGGGGGGSSKDEDDNKTRKYVEIEYKLQNSSTATIGMSGMPSMRYAEALARETAKPFRLNTVVSIDAAPLPTRTAAPVYTELLQPRSGEPPQHAACLRHEYRENLRRSFTQVLRSSHLSPTKKLAHHRAAEGGKREEDEEDGSDTLQLETGYGMGGGTAGFSTQVRPPEIYGPVKQAQMLEESHVEMLMRTVHKVKEVQKYEKMWNHNNF